jgi:hypothetical protein
LTPYPSTEGTRISPRWLLAACIGLLACALPLLAAPGAHAGPPVHSPLLGESIEGLNHACGVAVDSQGDVYASSAGETPPKIEVFSPTDHETPIAELTEGLEGTEPCALAVDTSGNLYVSERATGEVLRYRPTAYPFAGAPSYEPPVTIDASGEARGIAVDPTDDRLYVAEGSRIVTYAANGDRGIDEVQNVRAPSSGKYELCFESQCTAELEFSATHAEVQAALEALSTIGSGNVSVGPLPQEPDNLTAHQVAFGGPLASTDIEQLTCSSDCDVSTPVQGWDGYIGEGELSEATAVAAYTYKGSAGADYDQLYLFVADSASDSVKVFAAKGVANLSPRPSIDGSKSGELELDKTPDEGFGFGPGGASLSADPASGHIFVYDDEHAAVDEFEASGEFVTQIASSEFEDAEPTGIAAYPDRDELQRLDIVCDGGSFTLSFDPDEAGPEAPEQTPALPCNATAKDIEVALQGLTSIGEGNVTVFGEHFDKSGSYTIAFVEGLGSRDVPELVPDPAGLTEFFTPSASVTTDAQGSGPGRVYVTAGPDAEAKVLAFTPLARAQRPPLPAGDSFTLEGAASVTVDRFGNRYVGTEATIGIYPPGSQTPLLTFEDGRKPWDIAVDSECNVYTLDHNLDEQFNEVVSYYAPSSCPPTAETTYTRSEPVVEQSEVERKPDGIGLDPATDRLYVSFIGTVMKFESARNGSGIIDESWGTGFSGASDIDVCAATDAVYLSVENGAFIDVLNSAGTRRLARITGRGSPKGQFYPHDSIAVSQENCHVLTFAANRGVAEEYEPTGAFVSQFGAFSAEARNVPYRVAIDNACALHRDEKTGELDPLDSSTTPTCAEFDPSNGDAYVAFDDTNPEVNPYDLSAFAPLTYAPPPTAVTGTASEVGGGGATLNGTVNPNGGALASCTFQFLEASRYEENEEPLFEGAEEAPCAEGGAEIGKGTRPVPVHAEISGLDPSGRYYFRLLASNPTAADAGDAGRFGPPQLTTEAPNPVGYREATANVTIDPFGLATTYRVHYGTSEAYGQSTSALQIPASAGPTEVHIPLVGLQEGTEYHYCVAVENSVQALPCTDQTVVTRQRLESPPECPNEQFRTGFSAHLPDCRAYELVTPADTGGLRPDAPQSLTHQFDIWPVAPRGEAAGDRVGFYAQGTLSGFEGNGLGDSYRAERGAGPHPEGGWTSELYSPTYSEASVSFEHNFSQEGVSPDQEYSVWKVPAVAGTLGEGNYLRTPGGFELLGQGSLGVDRDAYSHYVSAGGTHVLFSSKAHLEPDAPPAPTKAIYDRAAAGSSAHVVSLKPGNTPFGSGKDATYVGATEDGRAIALKVGGVLYLRQNNEKTIQVAGGPNTFAGISSDGKRVFYVDAAVGGPNPEAKGLWIFDAETLAATKIAANSRFVNVSADGSRVYFTSTDVLDDAHEGAPGEGNVYVWDEATAAIRLVAILDPMDFDEPGFFGGPSNLVQWPAAIGGEGRGLSPTRSTPDGSVLVFESYAQPTPYDNTEASAADCGDSETSGEHCLEIYRYDDRAPAGERLSCLSCDPTGARPGGDSILQQLVALTAGIKWSLLPNLTEDGSRVVFQSDAALLPEDANRAADVYEWLAPGTGSCTRAGGCLALISSGQGEQDSTFYGMTPDGHDIFFTTQEKLIGADLSGSYSIYDAREGGGIPEAAAEAPCQGDACQGQGSSPPALPVPASTGPGGGNYNKGSAKRRCPKGKRLVRRHGKVRCVKKRHRSHHHKRREAHR